MKTNRVFALLLALRSLWCVFVVSMRVLWCGWFRCKRSKVDALAYHWARKMLHIMRVQYTVFNPHQVSMEPGRRYIIMSNHASHYDIPLIYVTFPFASIRMIAKKELFRVPIWGRAMREGEFIAIDRDNPRQAVKDMQRAREKMEDGIVLWVSPEGTRTRTGDLQSFKKGGFRIAEKTGATIIPVGIVGSGNILPPGTWEFSRGETVEIRIGQPIDTAQYAPKERANLSKDVESSIRQLIG